MCALAALHFFSSEKNRCIQYLQAESIGTTKTLVLGWRPNHTMYNYVVSKKKQKPQTKRYSKRWSKHHHLILGKKGRLRLSNYPYSCHFLLISLSIYIYAVRHTHIVHHNTEYITPISPITSDLLQSQSPSTLPNSIPVIASYSTISISLEKGICVLMRPLCVLVTVPARLRSDVQLWTECKQAGVRRLHGVPVESRRSLK